MRSTAARFFVGARAPLVGVQNLWSGPKLLLISLIPAILSTALFIVSFSFGIGHISVWLALYAPAAVGFWGTLFYWTFFIFGYVLYVLLVAILTYLVSQIVLMPINSVIAERVLKFEGVLGDERFEWSRWLNRTGRLLLIMIFQIGFFAVLGILVFILSFLPGLNLLAAFLGFLILSFNCADYAMELADLNLRAKLKLFKSRLPEFCGMAAVLGLTFLIPLLNFFFLPIAVSGASWLLSSFDELWKKQRTLS